MKTIRNVFGRDAQRICQAESRVTDESLSRDETSFVRLPQVTVNVVVANQNN